MVNDRRTRSLSKEMQLRWKRKRSGDSQLVLGRRAPGSTPLHLAERPDHVVTAAATMGTCQPLTGSRCQETGGSSAAFVYSASRQGHSREERGERQREKESRVCVCLCWEGGCDIVNLKIK